METNFNTKESGEMHREEIFNMAFDSIISKRDNHAKTLVELFKQYWNYNYPFMDELPMPDDDVIEVTIACHVSIAAAAFTLANVVLDTYIKNYMK